MIDEYEFQKMVIRRLDGLEASIAELNTRTLSLIRLGPKSQSPSAEIAQQQEIVERIREVVKETTPWDKVPTDGICEDFLSKNPDAGAPCPIDPATGMHKSYWVLPEEERAKGFVRPVRSSYIHDACGTVTTMSRSIAETYARNPNYYGSTFCVHCKTHLPVGENGEFKWEDGSRVGT